MRFFLFGIYAAGAILSLLFFTGLEWWLALSLVAAAPWIALYVAEYKGLVRFQQIQQQPTQLRAIDKAALSGMTDEEAADKFGWAIVNEMDETIRNLEDMLKQAKENRDGFATLVKGEKQ